ncbi:MAG: alpha/beta hydrolase [Candidatus Gastranaerophilales bacterium]|nr:alpha/beta hydrolase [Candidatus Gastranaerophilales bacterium]
MAKKQHTHTNIQMSPMMHAIRAVHSVTFAGASISPEDLNRQRAGQDLFGKLVTPIIGVHSKPFTIDTMSAEWICPDMGHDSRHVLLYCHGGGYTCGSLQYARILASKLCLHIGLEVLSFEYRLSPEHPYPAAIEDALRAWDYLMHLGYGASKVLVAGDSAGGNLALELCLSLKNQGRMQPRALILMSPWTDMTACGPSYKKCLELDPLLTPEYITAVRNAYAGEDADYALPQYSPLFADLSGLPPTLIQVGSNEILLSDSVRLAKALKQKNIPATLTIYQNCWHVFQQMPMRKSSQAMDEIGRFVWHVL